MSSCPPRRQQRSLLASATWDDQVERHLADAQASIDAVLSVMPPWAELDAISRAVYSSAVIAREAVAKAAARHAIVESYPAEPWTAAPLDGPEPEPTPWDEAQGGLFRGK